MVVTETERSHVTENSRWYLYFDESGDNNFSPNGSKHFILTCVGTRKPFPHIEPLYNLKCDCLANGLSAKVCKNAHEFHATEDTQATRDAVFEIIRNSLENFFAYSVIIRKNKTNPTIRDMHNLYSRVFHWLVDYLLNHEPILRGDETILITDALPLQKKRDAVKDTLKIAYHKKALERGISYKLYHHNSESDINLQIADYFCWAIQRQYEQNIEGSHSYRLVD